VFYFDYPKVKQSLGVAALRDAYPTLYLDSRADVRGVNPLALWMWGALKADEPLYPERLLGINAFTMVAKQFQRIPVDQNKEFYTKSSAKVKRLDARPRVKYYAPFIAAMQADPSRAAIYEAAPHYPEREWENHLKIAHPDQPECMLEFQASIYRMEQDSGFLVVYYPVSSTVPIVEEINSSLIERFGKVISLQPDRQERDHPEKMLRATGYHAFFRSYYPRLIQDPLWYLCAENRAHYLMMGMSVVDMHFFELFLTPLVRYFLGAIQESTAPRALKYFDMYTAQYMRDGHDLHEQYEKTMQRLSRLEGFSAVLECSRRWQIHINQEAQINLIDTSDDPFYTCRVILPWRYDTDVHLQFKSMVRYLFEEGLVPQMDRRKYEVTLVPENYETDVAMILLPLLSFPPSPPDDGETTAYRQFLWLLALLKVVEEAMETEEEDTTWEPEESFERMHSALKSRSGAPTQERANALMTEIRIAIELLDRKGKIEKPILLKLLRSYMLTQPHLEPLSTFLTQELEMMQSVYMAF